MEERSLNQTYGKAVYNDEGFLFGRVHDVVLGKFSIQGWVVSIPPESVLKKAAQTVKAVIVPHKAVKATGDILIISSRLEVPQPSPGEEAEAV
jgi:sporulation protein YlmC with PRC-barrel domain